jgi:hypoxanthine phosphoribosyltransferase
MESGISMRVLITTEQIQERVAAMARAIGPEYRDRPLTIVGVLTGSLMFVADLVRRLDIPLRIGLIQASSYRGKTTKAGELHLGPELLADVRDRHVLLLDDILDTGQTLAHLVRHLHEQGAASVKVAVLLRKEGRQIHAVRADFIGFDIPNEFVVGYGLDFNDEHRQLPYIAVLPPQVD